MSFPGGNRALRFLSANQIAALYEVHVLRCGPSQPILLQSAADSPPNNCHYGEKDLFKLAGILSERIILNHSFQDGNKRAAFLAADMFLKINRFKLQKRQFAKDDEEVNEAMKNALLCVASNQWSPMSWRIITGVSRRKWVSDPVAVSSDTDHIGSPSAGSTLGEDGLHSILG